MLFRHRARLLTGAAALVGIGMSGGAWANTLTVSADVPAQCSIIAGELNFGTYVAGTDQDSSGGFEVECSSQATLSITLDAGLHGNGGARNMERDGGTERLGYILYTDAGRLTQWNPDTISKDVLVASGAPTSVDVFGTITAQNPPSGLYSDIVTISFTVQ